MVCNIFDIEFTEWNGAFYCNTHYDVRAETQLLRKRNPSSTLTECRAHKMLKFDEHDSTLDWIGPLETRDPLPAAVDADIEYIADSDDQRYYLDIPIFPISLPRFWSNEEESENQVTNASSCVRSVSLSCDDVGFFRQHFADLVVYGVSEFGASIQDLTAMLGKLGKPVSTTAAKNLKQKLCPYAFHYSRKVCGRLD